MNRGDLVAAVERSAVQRLDVGEQMGELEPVGRHMAARQPVEHERIIGIGTMGDCDVHQRTAEAGESSSSGGM